jgi:hypothetical protein
MGPRICPWWLGYLPVSPIRRLLRDPLIVARHTQKPTHMLKAPSFPLQLQGALDENGNCPLAAYCLQMAPWPRVDLPSVLPGELLGFLFRFVTSEELHASGIM